jgi:hypothetical protein
MVMKGSLKLLAHLVNQQVVGSFLALQIAVLLLEKPTGFFPPLRFLGIPAQRCR